MKILAIESSCDDTGVSVSEGRKILSNVLASQIEIHKKYGGVVPEIAARKHLEIISYLVQEALQKAELSVSDIDVFAATYGPGLVGSLLIGLSFAKGLAISENRPFVAVNHLYGHIFSNFLSFPHLEFPYIVLLVSGGHTEILIVRSYDDITKIGKTIDDAAGEAFDKIARILGLNYPGGPEIERIADGGKEIYKFPRPLSKKDNFDFSFSGLKTSVLYFFKKNRDKFDIKDIAYSFQEAIVDVLTKKVFSAARKNKVKNIVFAGGVAENKRLRERAEEIANVEKANIYFPPLSQCTDNAAMIAIAANEKIQKREEYSPLSTNAIPYLDIEND
jgi:N6-L-threonylcarbamoyladenine synthase